MYQLHSRKYWADPYLPIQFEFRDPQSPFPLHVHDFHEIILIYSGTATHLTVNGDYDVQSGDLINVKPGQAHGYKNIRNLILMNIMIKPSFFEEDYFGIHSLSSYETLFGQEPEEGTGKLPITHFKLEYGVFSRGKNLVETARTELAERPDGYRAMVNSLIRELIVLLIRNYQEKNAYPPGYVANVTNLINYVRDNYRSSLSMDDLIGISSLSESHILRLFKQYLGCSPFQYISRLRLSAATDALIQTDRTITEIALDLGFNDSNYFTRSFRKHLGLSPREYRNKYVRENIL